jgi:probable F420-dependent oxidoreductase
LALEGYSFPLASLGFDISVTEEDAMRLGVVFPQTEIGVDPGAIRDYVQTAEDLGYSHLIAYDHVLGADTQFHQRWSGGYTSRDVFHEPLVAFGYMAAITKSLELVTAILILGQRQTALVAKQAAEVDVLSGGRLRLGVGIGWNHVEYEALGQDFHNRGRRSVEQISLLRALWTQEVVNFQGRWHRVTNAGINPLPVQRPIPIWMGVGGRLSPVPTERVLRRIARLADGWFPQFPPDDTGRETVARVREYARAEGRDPSAIGIEARINIADGNPELWVERAEAWQELGATHVSVNTMRAGLGSPEAHIDAIRQFKEVVRG